MRYVTSLLFCSGRRNVLSLEIADRLFWLMLSRLWTQWRSTLVIVKPETVIEWQRKSFRYVLALEEQSREVG